MMVNSITEAKVLGPRVSMLLPASSQMGSTLGSFARFTQDQFAFEFQVVQLYVVLVQLLDAYILLDGQMLKPVVENTTGMLFNMIPRIA